MFHYTGGLQTLTIVYQRR